MVKDTTNHNETSIRGVELLHRQDHWVLAVVMMNQAKESFSALVKHTLGSIRKCKFPSRASKQQQQEQLYHSIQAVHSMLTQQMMPCAVKDPSTLKRPFLAASFKTADLLQRIQMRCHKWTQKRRIKMLLAEKRYLKYLADFQKELDLLEGYLQMSYTAMTAASADIPSVSPHKRQEFEAEQKKWEKRLQKFEQESGLGENKNAEPAPKTVVVVSGQDEEKNSKIAAADTVKTQKEPLSENILEMEEEVTEKLSDMETEIEADRKEFEKLLGTLEEKPLVGEEENKAQKAVVPGGDEQIMVSNEAPVDLAMKNWNVQEEGGIPAAGIQDLDPHTRSLAEHLLDDKPKPNNSFKFQVRAREKETRDALHTHPKTAWSNRIVKIKQPCKFY